MKQYLLLVRREWVNSNALWSYHRELWAEDGDALSSIYASAGALNTSFTRSGKRSLAGMNRNYLLRYDSVAKPVVAQAYCRTRLKAFREHISTTCTGPVRRSKDRFLKLLRGGKFFSKEQSRIEI